MYQITENEEYGNFAEYQIAFLSAQAQYYTAGHSMFLLTKLMYENPPEHITVALKNNTDLQNIRGKIPLLANISVVSQSKEYPLLNNRTTYYVCKNHSCLPPTNEYDF